MLGKVQCLTGSKTYSEAIAEKTTHFVKIPISKADIINTMADLHTMAEFPNVVGAIDFTHIKMYNPRGEYSSIEKASSLFIVKRRARLI